MAVEEKSFSPALSRINAIKRLESLLPGLMRNAATDCERVVATIFEVEIKFVNTLHFFKIVELVYLKKNFLLS